MQKVEVKITPEGKIEVETSGFKGQACLKATEGLKRAFGGDAVAEMKPEFHEQEMEQNVEAR